ncbi:ribosomal protein S15 [Orobanche hederae]
MADVEIDVAGQPKKRTFKKFSYRGTDLDALLDMSTDELVKLFPARARRRMRKQIGSEILTFAGVKKGDEVQI